MKYRIQKISAVNDGAKAGYLIAFNRQNEFRSFIVWRTGSWPNENWSVPIKWINKPSYIEIDENEKGSYWMDIKIYLQEFPNIKQNKKTIEGELII